MNKFKYITFAESIYVPESREIFGVTSVENVYIVHSNQIKT